MTTWSLEELNALHAGVMGVASQAAIDGAAWEAKRDLPPDNDELADGLPEGDVSGPVTPPPPTPSLIWLALIPAVLIGIVAFVSFVQRSVGPGSNNSTIVKEASFCDRQSEFDKALKGDISDLRQYLSRCRASGGMYVQRVELELESRVNKQAKDKEAKDKADAALREQEQREKVQYDLARGNVTRLRAYRHECRSCKFWDEAGREIEALEKALVTQQLRRQTEDFLKTWYPTLSVSNANLNWALRDAYADNVLYFKNHLTRDQVIARIFSNFERWPQRQFFLHSNSVGIQCNETSLSCTARGTVGIDHSSVARNRRASGTGTFEYTFSYASLTAAPRITQEDGTPGTVTEQPLVSEVTFITYQSRDIHGGDYQRLDSVTLSTCESTCRSHSQCVAYTFNRWAGVCFLKSTISSLSIEPRATTGVRSDMRTPSNSTKPVTMARYRNRVFPGDGYTNFLGSLEQCESTCQSASQCIAFTIRKSNRRCTLFNYTEEYFSNNDFDSGVKIQN